MCATQMRFKPIFLAFLLVILFLANTSAAATVSGSAAKLELISAYELQKIVLLALTSGRVIPMGESEMLTVLEFRDGELRQYIAVQAALVPEGRFDVSAVHLSQELWTKGKFGQIIVNQWLISIQGDQATATHYQLVEVQERIVGQKALPSHDADIVAVTRAVVRRFLGF